MKILFAVSEAIPFAASGGLADVGGSLPRAIRNRGNACRVVMPLYDTIAPQYRERMEFVAEFSVQLSWRRQSCSVYRLTEGGVVYYFLENNYYFQRGKLYGEFDDGERFAFFSKAVLDMLEPVGFIPDVIHCNDWQTALIPTYLNLFYRSRDAFREIGTIFTIHNIQFQGKYGMDMVQDVLGIPPAMQGTVEYDGCCNLMKGAIEQANLVTTVSPTYAVELMDPWFSYGMDRLLREHRAKLSGITNGIDTALYDPVRDPLLPARYSAQDPGSKKVCRREMQKTMGIETNQNPVVAMVTRLTYQKGIDLLRYIFEEMMQLPISFVLLGSGDWDYEQFFLDMQGRYPGRVGVNIGFDAALSRRIYAGADLFLILPGHFRSKAVIGHAAPGGGSGGAKGLVQSGHRPSYRSSVRRASSPSGMQGSGPLLRFCWVSQPLPASRTTAGRRAPRIACSTACSRLGTTVYAFP